MRDEKGKVVTESKEKQRIIRVLWKYIFKTAKSRKRILCKYDFTILNWDDKNNF